MDAPAYRWGMDTTTLIRELKTTDPVAIRARLDELAAEDRALRELLRLVNRAKAERRRKQAEVGDA